MDWENKRWSSNIFLQSWAITVQLEFVLHNVVNSQSKRLIIECQSFLYNCILAEFWPPFGTCGKLEGTSLSFAWTLRDFYERGQKKERVEKVKPTLHFITSWKRPAESSFNFGQSFLLSYLLVLLMSGICLVRLRTFLPFSTLTTDF